MWGARSLPKQGSPTYPAQSDQIETGEILTQTPLINLAKTKEEAYLMINVI